MSSNAHGIRSEISWSTRERIFVRGLDLADDILGQMSIAEFALFQSTGRRPTPEEVAVYDALVIALAEHGLTPSVLAARLTYSGAPESLQAAVAAGVAGLGSVFVGSTEDAARMLTESVAEDPAASDDVLARRIVDEHTSAGVRIPGLGHSIHTAADPRAARVFAIAAENGLSTRYVGLMEAVAAEAADATGRHLPINATGAIGAVASELGVPWRLVRGLGVVARAIGIIGHLGEEIEHPIAREIWARVDREASTAHTEEDLR